MSSYNVCGRNGSSAHNGKGSNSWQFHLFGYFNFAFVYLEMIYWYFEIVYFLKLYNKTNSRNLLSSIGLCFHVIVEKNSLFFISRPYFLSSFVSSLITYNFFASLSRIKWHN